MKSYDDRGLKFGTVAEAYDRLRPTPPTEAQQIVGNVAGLSVVEVGAGTGLWTRFLQELGAVVTAIEPDDDMRRVLERRSPDLTVLKGTAEHLPLEDDAFDAALVSSAWHWFTQPEASIEIARVLHDDAPLYVVWNGFSRDVAWMAELASLRERPDDAGRRPRGWSAELAPDGPFINAVEFSFNWIRTMTEDELVALFFTFSGAIIRTPDEREALEAKLRVGIREHARGAVIEVPMTLRGTKARRRPR